MAMSASIELGPWISLKTLISLANFDFNNEALTPVLVRQKTEVKIHGSLLK